jgi:hypothetical protein
MHQLHVHGIAFSLISLLLEVCMFDTSSAAENFAAWFMCFAFLTLFKNFQTETG